MKTIKFLNFLNISHNKITDEAVDDILAFLYENSALCYLHLSYNNPLKANILSKNFGIETSQDTKLKALDLRFNSLSTTTVAKKITLQTTKSWLVKVRQQ